MIAPLDRLRTQRRSPPVFSLRFFGSACTVVCGRCALGEPQRSPAAVTRASAVRPRAAREHDRDQLELLPHHHLQHSFGKISDRWVERHGAARRCRRRPWIELARVEPTARASRVQRRRRRSRDGTRRKASPHQPLPQLEPARGQPALNRRHRPVELTGRVVVRHPLKVAQLDRRIDTLPAACPAPHSVRHRISFRSTSPAGSSMA